MRQGQTDGIAKRSFSESLIDRKGSESLDWFPFDVRDWLTSRTVSLMSFAAQGLYIRLLCFQWCDGSIPSDQGKLARLSGLSQGDFDALWNEVSECFESLDGEPAELVNPRLHSVKLAQEARRAERSEAGRKGNAKRWGLKGSSRGDRSAIAQRSNSDSLNDRNKSKRKSNAKAAALAENACAFRLGERLDTPAARKAWEEFQAHRKNMGNKSYTGSGVEKLRQVLDDEGYTPEAFVNLCENAITGQWKGLPVEAIRRLAPKNAKGARPQQAAEPVASVVDRLTADLGGAA